MNEINVHDCRFYSFAFQNSPHLGQARLSRWKECMKATQSKQLSRNVNGTERTQQQKDINGDLQLQLQNKQKELEAAQEMVQLLRKREKNLTDR